MFAYGTTVLLLKRSILTEKVARRGFHVTREYAVDPLEILFVREVMRTKLVAIPAGATIEDLRHTLVRARRIAASISIQWWTMKDNQRRNHAQTDRMTMKSVFSKCVPRQSLERTGGGVSGRTTTRGRPSHGRDGSYKASVVDATSGRLAGMISLRDLLLARVRNLNEERHRERVLKVRLPAGSHAA